MGADLVLSLFPGIDLLGRGFEAEGFCVVRGPDLLWGGDIRRFRPPAGVFGGVIGGPPCQDFSRARSAPATGYGLEMLEEWRRCVVEAEPEWFLMENVDCTPDVKIEGYSYQRMDVWAHDFGVKQRRLRHFQFGCSDARVAVLERGGGDGEGLSGTITASDGVTPWERFCELQGLPDGFDLPTWTNGAKRRAVGNGVPVPMAAAMAAAVRGRRRDARVCGCGCGRPVDGRKVYAGVGCRVRESRRRNSPDRN